MKETLSSAIDSFLWIEGTKCKRLIDLYHDEVIEDFLFYLSRSRKSVNISDISKRDIESYLREAIDIKEEIISQYFLNRERIIEAFCIHLVRTGVLINNPYNL